MTNEVRVTFSHSSLKKYEQCPKQYHEVTVLRKYPFKDTQATIYGKEVHSAIELYGKGEAEWDERYDILRPAVDAVLAKPGRKLFEHEMGVTVDLQPCDFHDENRWVRGIADLLIINDDNLTARVVDWKGLALDTELPTPQGWTTMGAVQVGDTLFDAQGQPCKVTGKSEVKRLRCYEILFDDTTRVVCDEEHLWTLSDGTVVPVTQLRGKKAHPKDASPSKIAVAAPLKLEGGELPIDPYVLGLWLADGKHSSGELSKPDAFIWEEIQRCGYAINMETGGKKACPTRTVQGLANQLAALDILRNKHIPQAFLRGSYAQRLALLQGLMDGDGNANPARKQAIFTTIDKQLSDQVMELLCSLGQRPLQSYVEKFGFGKPVTVYPISFRPVGINPFRLPRKAAKIDAAWGAGESSFRRVVSVVEVPSVPTQCIAVNSPDRTFLCTRRMIPTHNTGSDKYPDTDQLVLMSLMVFVHFPHIRSVSSALMFLVKGSMTTHRMERDQAPAAWQRYRERVAKIQASHANGVWNPQQSPLCRFCPVTECTFNRS